MSDFKALRLHERSAAPKPGGKVSSSHGWERVYRICGTVAAAWGISWQLQGQSYSYCGDHSKPRASRCITG